MANTLKAFVVLDDKQNNNPGVTSLHGELSKTSLSYSTEIGRYASTTNTNIALATFSYKNEEGQRLVVPNEHLNPCWATTNWIVTASRDGTITQNEAAFKLGFQQEFTSILELIDSGNHVTDNNVIIPSFVKFRLVSDGTIIHLWFADAAFQDEYDEYEIVIVPPIDDLNQFMDSIEVVEPLLAARDNQQIFAKLFAATNGLPYTKADSYNWQWVQSNVTTNKLNTQWTVAIYGIAGINPEVVKTEIAKYILANSRYNEVEWAPVFPELFNPSEFVLIPSWGSVSIEGGVSTDLYQPSLRLKTGVGFAKAVCPEYAEQHISDHLTHLAAIYKSIGFLAIGAANNPDKIFSLEEKFPDYILASNIEPDFARMSQTTQKWVDVLHRMLKTAETMDASTELPENYYLLRRNGYTFLSHRLNGVNYLMLTYRSWMEHFHQN